ncbi:hypothetical protein HanPI659440_Chr09g0342551 [Helianthus annuus]|nr:hypothetical protein HanPI659440_Chr09g0342551 [Helianthus annuus]
MKEDEDDIHRLRFFFTFADNMSWSNLNHISASRPTQTRARLFRKAVWRGLLSLILTMGEEIMITRNDFLFLMREDENQMVLKYNL